MFRVSFAEQRLGDVAHLGERRPCTAEVAGSTPVISIEVAINSKFKY